MMRPTQVELSVLNGVRESELEVEAQEVGLDRIEKMCPWQVETPV